MCAPASARRCHDPPEASETVELEPHEPRAEVPRGGSVGAAQAPGVEAARPAAARWFAPGAALAKAQAGGTKGPKVMIMYIMLR